ncbi:MAG: DinB family protein [Chloroflexota bacterium]
MFKESPNPTTVAKLIEKTPAVLKTMLTELDDSLLSWKPADGEWCIKEVIGHLIDMDTLAFADRIQIILDNDTPDMASLDVDEIEAKREDFKRPLAELLLEFEQARETAVAFLMQLPPDQLQRTGVFPVERYFKASDFLYEWPYHDHDHLKQISDIIQASVWGQLSETMQRALRR